MALIPFRPLFDLDNFFSDDDWAMSMYSSSGRPAMDMYETEKEVVAKFQLPGIDPEKVQVSVENGVLSVKAEHEQEKEDHQKGYWRREIRSGSYQRMIKLPQDVNESKVDAQYEKGILTIMLPKLEKKENGKKIQVKVKGK